MIETISAKVGTVALYVDMGRESARRAAADVAGAMRGAGFEVALCEDQDRELHLGTSGSSAETMSAIRPVLPGVNWAGRSVYGIPLFGINTGRLGFLTEMDGRSEDLTKLPDILRAGLSIDERSALSTELRGTTRMALNDVVVRRTGDSHMTPFSIFVDGKEAARVPADGVAVATPTGSTAYFLSGGGPILAPDVAAFGIIALLPHTLFSRPLVVRDDSRIEVVSNADVESVALDCDGRTVDRLQPGERVLVTRYPFSVRFARRAPLDFFTLLEDKLRWNAPIKDG